MAIFYKKYISQPHPFIVGVIFLVSVVYIGYGFLFSGDRVDISGQGIFRGEVIRVISEIELKVAHGNRSNIEQQLSVRAVINGVERDVRVLNDFVPVSEGEKLYVQASGLGEPGENFYVVDIIRTDAIWILVLAFVGLVLIVSGKKGFGAIVGLIFSFVVIFSYIIPLIINGVNPVWVGLSGAVLILLISFYVSHGFNRKSFSALAGISITLLIVGIISTLSVDHFHFSGFSGEESVFLNFDTQNRLNLIGILIAGILIAVIGVLDDIAITQASIVFNLKYSDRTLGQRALFKRAMSIGQDHISAVINTLVLAYTGAALPLLLLLSLNKFPVDFIINGELISEEIVRTLVSSSGLVLAVPITTLVAVLLCPAEGEHNDDSDGHHH